jgi:release factor glutamine methyltransferase
VREGRPRIETDATPKPEPRIGELLREAAGRLGALQQASPRLEAELLLGDATGLDRTRILAWPERMLGEAELARFRSLVARRLAGEPIAYIRGHQAFWNQELRVTPDTLIPRPETELLVELALERLPADRPLRVLDAGTGSGAIAAALACERPDWTLIATEHSLAAAVVARDNLRRLAPRNARVVNCHWLAPIADGCLDALISNPPYIPDTDPHLDRGDLPFEPRRALAAGADGLDAVRRLSAQAPLSLRPGAIIALEHGSDQGPAVREILRSRGFEQVLTHRDLAGLERATTGQCSDLET